MGRGGHHAPLILSPEPLESLGDSVPLLERGPRAREWSPRRRERRRARRTLYPARGV